MHRLLWTGCATSWATGWPNVWEAIGSRTTIEHRWAAIPTVTATAKPAVTPVAGEVAGDRLGATFQPAMKGSGRTARVKELREAMESAGYQIINAGTLEIPLNAGARGWLETGEIDKHGHHHRAVPFARQIERELDAWSAASPASSRRAGARCGSSQTTAGSTSRADYPWSPCPGTSPSPSGRAAPSSRATQARRASPSLALEPQRVVCLSARNRLLQPEGRVRARRPQHTGMPHPGHPGRRHRSQRTDRRNPGSRLAPSTLQHHRPGPGGPSQRICVLTAPPASRSPPRPSQSMRTVSPAWSLADDEHETLRSSSW